MNMGPGMVKRTLIAAACVLTAQALSAGPGLADGDQAGPAAVATIRDIRRTVLPDAVRLTIELDGEVAFHDERIQNPARVFIDLPGTRAVAALIDQTLRFDLDADIVRQVRVGRHPHNTTRVVFDAAGVSIPAMHDLGPAALRARRLTAMWLRRPPAGSPRATALLIDVYNATDATPPAVEPAVEAAVKTVASPAAAPAPIAAAAPPSKNTTGGLSMSRQLGLGVSRIVIDAGHGGHDPGAKGKGVTEAELVLDVALRVEKLLQKIPGVDVILTRRTDEFIPLQERTAIANREGADLFLLIHANASPNAQARGIETYFLNFANNLGAAAVAARENAASGQTMGALPDLVKAIALNNKLDESRDFATQIQRAMLDRLKAANKTIKDLGVKQAPFVVLIGAAMPSVLAEISFVTNPQEARLLKSNAYRQRIAESLFNAIRKYQTSLKNGMSVAPQ